jgi:hypothetical protein
MVTKKCANIRSIRENRTTKKVRKQDLHLQKNWGDGSPNPLEPPDDNLAWKKPTTTEAKLEKLVSKGLLQKKSLGKLRYHFTLCTVQDFDWGQQWWGHLNDLFYIDPNNNTKRWNDGSLHYPTTIMSPKVAQQCLRHHQSIWLSSNSWKP